MSAVLDPLVESRRLVDVAFRADPYPAYRAMREEGPIHWSTDFFGGAWLLPRHADVTTALKDPRFSAQRTGGWVAAAERTPGELNQFRRLFARAMLFRDGADHQRLRALIQPAFRPEALHGLAERIDATVEGLLDKIDPRSGFDAMADLARPLAMAVIGMVLGIESHDMAAFRRSAESVSAFLAAAQPDPALGRRAQAGLLGISRYFGERVRRRPIKLADDIVSRLVEARLAGDSEDGPELLAQCAMLLIAGYETTHYLLGNAIHALLTHPEQWEMLKARPDMVERAVREVLRHDGPVQYTGRRVTTGMHLHGVSLRRGDLVIALIGSANRDPCRFSDPETFDITREPAASLAFGAGPHACVGAPLLMLEATSALRHLAARWPRLVVGCSARSGSTLFRGFDALQLRSPVGTASVPRRFA